MNKKILVSLAVIGVAAAIAVGGTIAYFSDTETSTGNTFTAGTIDIDIDRQNPWTDSFILEDMKPCYTDYINFRINNDLGDPNPVNIFKKITVTGEETGVMTEPECEDQYGDWHDLGNGVGECRSLSEDLNNLSKVIWYDLSVEVYNSQDELIWHQVIYKDSDMKSIYDVYGNYCEGDDGLFLGMIPANGYMLVEQSYHLQPEAGNAYQGDIMTFDIQVKGQQLYGTAWLDNKVDADGLPGTVYLTPGDGIGGTLTYDVKGPEFDFEFVGVVPSNNKDYCLFVGGTAGAGGWNPDHNVGCDTSDGSGNITITGSANTGDMKDVKAWVVSDNSGSTITTWGSMANWLWETGMIWYEDTDL